MTDFRATAGVVKREPKTSCAANKERSAQNMVGVFPKDTEPPEELPKAKSAWHIMAVQHIVIAIM
jgi:hypothetical protein